MVWDAQDGGLGGSSTASHFLVPHSRVLVHAGPSAKLQPLALIPETMSHVHRRVLGAQRLRRPGVTVIRHRWTMQASPLPAVCVRQAPLHPWLVQKPMDPRPPNGKISVQHELRLHTTLLPRAAPHAGVAWPRSMAQADMFHEESLLAWRQNDANKQGATCSGHQPVQQGAAAAVAGTATAARASYDGDG